MNTPALLIGQPVDLSEKVSHIIAEVGQPLLHGGVSYIPVRYEDGSYDVLECLEACHSTWARSHLIMPEVAAAIASARTMSTLTSVSASSILVHFEDKDGRALIARIWIGFAAMHFHDELLAAVTRRELVTA